MLKLRAQTAAKSGALRRPQGGLWWCSQESNPLGILAGQLGVAASTQTRAGPAVFLTRGQPGVGLWGWLLAKGWLECLTLAVFVTIVLVACCCGWLSGI